MSCEEYNASCEGLQGKSCSVITRTVAQWSADGKMVSGLKQVIDTYDGKVKNLTKENIELKKQMVVNVKNAKLIGTLNGIGMCVLGYTILVKAKDVYLSYKKRKERKHEAVELTCRTV